MNMNKSITRRAIADEIKKLKKFPGVLGELNLRADGRVLSNPNVKMIKNGSVVRVY